MSATWNTKYGTRRVRRDPPTLMEAIAAAQGLTDDVDAQAGIAAELMGMPTEAVKIEMKRMAPDRRAKGTLTASGTAKRAPRTVVVERKASRRVLAKGVPVRGADQGGSFAAGGLRSKV